VPPQELALAGSSQATAVEIPDDDTPPPGWDQWGILPAPAPEPQAGALVRRWDGHMVAGGSRHGVEASSSRAAPWLERSSSGPGAGAGARRLAIPPLRRHPRGAAAVGGATRPRRFAQPSADRGAADPRRPCVACLPGMMSLLFSLFCRLRVRFSTLIGLRLLVAGAGAPRPRQVRRSCPNER
jgi:hypothetical protein